MSDRELLELAAKAAGIPRNQWDYDGMRQLGHMVTPRMMWNPLTDDGIALRLAADLRLRFEEKGDWRWEPRTPAWKGFWHVSRIRLRIDPNIIAVDEPHGIDRRSSLRRAIVRAAAEIGKAMP